MTQGFLLSTATSMLTASGVLSPALAAVACGDAGGSLLGCGGLTIEASIAARVST